MNIRARERARLSQRVPRPSASSFARLNFGRSRGQRRAPLSTASTAVRFAANAFRGAIFSEDGYSMQSIG
ncbi:unnamed protein product [Lasius platythorax]|uniref:Uncharacterized protein n=1 Tax=Lasius platythorax TaxID=488582 RepID=A0AAV2NUH3_9HYME